MTTAEIESLLERVRRATGPDRELDDAISAVVGGWHRGSFDWYDHAGKRRNQSPNFTASIDVTVALIERVLPGAHVGLDPIFFVDPMAVRWDAIICIPHMERWNPVNSDWIERIEARHDDRVLAIVAALLLALLHQASDKGMIE